MRAFAMKTGGVRVGVEFIAGNSGRVNAGAKATTAVPGLEEAVKTRECNKSTNDKIIE